MEVTETLPDDRRAVILWDAGGALWIVHEEHTPDRWVGSHSLLDALVDLLDCVYGELPVWLEPLAFRLSHRVFANDGGDLPD